MDISKFGKGAIKNPVDIRDYRFEVAIGAVVLPTEFSLRDKIGPIKNQDGSYSCVSQAFSYYAEVKNEIETKQKVQLSPRDIYSLVYLQEGGSYLRDNVKKICDTGIVPEIDASSYENGNPPSEAFMRKRDDITPEKQEKGMVYIGKSYFTWDNKNFDTYKQAIFKGDGCVLAGWGNDYCWANSVLLVPDVKEQCNWAHGVYATGWKIINGVEHIEFCNSWGSGWGDNGFGYMPKSYIEKGYVFNPVTYIDYPNTQYSNWMKTITLLKNLILLIQQLLKLKKK